MREIAEWFPQSRDLSTRLAGIYDDVAENLLAIADAGVALEEKKGILTRAGALDVSAVDDLERLLGCIPGDANGDRSDLSLPPATEAHTERSDERPVLLAEPTE